jgi:hypothetical protein
VIGLAELKLQGPVKLVVWTGAESEMRYTKQARLMRQNHHPSVTHIINDRTTKIGLAIPSSSFCCLRSFPSPGPLQICRLEPHPLGRGDASAISDLLAPLSLLYPPHHSRHQTTHILRRPSGLIRRLLHNSLSLLIVNYIHYLSALEATGSW